MKITKTSILTGIEHTREIAVTQERLDHWKSSGAHVQDVFPELTPDDREFLISGITPEEWEEAFGEESDDEAE